MSLMPWHDSFLRQWLTDCNMHADPDSRKAITDVCGHWPQFIYRLVGGDSVKDRLDKLRTSLSDALGSQDHKSALFKSFFINDPMTVKLLGTLAELDQVVPVDELAGFCDVPEAEAVNVMKWAQLCGLVEAYPDRGFTITGLPARVYLSAFKAMGLATV